MISIVFVGGDFDQENGRKSSYIDKLFIILKDLFDLKLKDKDYNIEIYNGGNLKTLEDITNRISSINILIWFPNINNSFSKFINLFKEKNKSLLLIRSKFNNNKKYSIHDLVAKALHTKSNLLVEFSKIDNKINSSIIDPLGNEFYNGFEIDCMAKELVERTLFLYSLKRVNSIKLDAKKFEVPLKEDFFKIVENYGKTFHKLIHAANQSRYLGNCSFRCEKGFSSFKQNDIIFMSKRNLDKRNINVDSFVPVKKDFKDIVEYYNEFKPSVDTPIQLLLYNKFKNINYILHSHVYIEKAPFTSKKIPCGAIEEYEEIVSLFNDFNNDYYIINLKGHGSIIMVKNVEQLNNIKYYQRNVLEK